MIKHQVQCSKEHLPGPRGTVEYSLTPLLQDDPCSPERRLSPTAWDQSPPGSLALVERNLHHTWPTIFEGVCTRSFPLYKALLPWTAIIARTCQFSGAVRRHTYISFVQTRLKLSSQLPTYTRQHTSLLIKRRLSLQS